MKTIFLILPLLCIVAGCATIRSKQWVGSEPVDLSPDEGISIEGTWMMEDGVAGTLKVLDAKKGKFLYTPDDPDDDPQTFTIRQTGDYQFLNTEKDDDGEYHWVLMKLSDNHNVIVLWMSDIDAFRKLIAAGKINGKNDPKKKKKDRGILQVSIPGAVIDDPKGKWVKKMIAGEFGVLFEWQDPIVLWKKPKTK